MQACLTAEVAAFAFVARGAAQRLKTHTRRHTKTLMCMQPHLTQTHHISLCHCLREIKCIHSSNIFFFLSIFLDPCCFLSFHHPFICVQATAAQIRMSWHCLINLLLLNFPPLKKFCQLKSFQTTKHGTSYCFRLSNDQSQDWQPGNLILDAWLAKFRYPHPGCLRVDHNGHCGLVGSREKKRPRQGDTAHTQQLYHTYVVLRLLNILWQ